MKYFKFEAIRILVGCPLSISGDKIIPDNKDAVIPTEEQIESKVKELEAEYEANQYQRDRAVEYAKLNQYELQFNDLENNTTTWQDAINGIKAKYPKPQ